MIRADLQILHEIEREMCAGFGLRFNAQVQLVLKYICSFFTEWYCDYRLLIHVRPLNTFYT